MNHREIKIDQDKLVQILIGIFMTFLAIIIIITSTLMYKGTLREKNFLILDFARTLYVELNLKTEVGLPFKIIFDSKGYTLYGNDTSIEQTFTIKTELPNHPKSGEIIIDEKGNITSKKLKYGPYYCSYRNSELTCTFLKA